jgi:hypothetical protein
MRSNIDGRNTGLEPIPEGGLGLRLILFGVATPDSMIPAEGEFEAGVMTDISSSNTLRRFEPGVISTPV